jgi:prevent-host-death family protein
MIERIIGVTDLQRNFKAVIDEVAERGVPYVLTRGSRPEAALLPYEEYLQLRNLQEKQVIFDLDQLLDRMRERTKERGEDEVVADVARARSEVGRP